MHAQVLIFLAAALSGIQAQSLPAGWTGKASFKQSGTSGIGAMQLAVVTDDKVIMMDRVEENPLRNKANGKNIPYWGAELSISTRKVRGLAMKTNSFCAGGAWLGDGRLLSAGGDGYQGNGNFAANGLQALRFFSPCDNGKCQIQENPSKTHMQSPRWYPATTRISDGSVFIAGGVSETAYMTDNPTIEYYPSKGKQQYSNFLHNALPWNLFPHAIALPDDRMFMAAGNHAMIYNRKTNSEQLLPNIPNGIQVNYPFGSAGALLPLTPENGYTPTILLCGGTAAKAGQSINSETPASNQCVRMDLTASGIAQGWQVEYMPEPRMMGNFVMTPDGKLVIINGAKSGAAGFYNDRNANTGYSSANHPVQTPYLYDPTAPQGQRWMGFGAYSNIPRMYHSTASLLPDGRVIVAGSNPNPNVNYQGPFPTEYRIEYLTLPNTAGTRPTFSGRPNKVKYGSQYTMKLKLPSGADMSKVSVVLMDLGFSTHGIQYNMRSVKLASSVARNGQTITFTGPPSAPIFPPGPAWLYVVYNGVPSLGKKLMLVK